MRWQDGRLTPDPEERCQNCELLKRPLRRGGCPLLLHDLREAWRGGLQLEVFACPLHLVPLGERARRPHHALD